AKISATNADMHIDPATSSVAQTEAQREVDAATAAVAGAQTRIKLAEKAIAAIDAVSGQ
ncbi:MAG: hypothetical protein HQ526_06565, partial [Actinobacteria bacterium]|nr:hypothetical protein [Actinomycetota bacterium]